MLRAESDCSEAPGSDDSNGRIGIVRISPDVVLPAPGRSLARRRRRRLDGAADASRPLHRASGFTPNQPHRRHLTQVIWLPPPDNRGHKLGANSVTRAIAKGGLASLPTGVALLASVRT